jgi:protein-disulfide isomerase
MSLKQPVTDADHTLGPDDAPVTLVEYGDYECPHCGAAEPIVKEVRRAMGDLLRTVFRNFPLRESHPHAEHAAEAAESAGAQGAYWQMHDLLFAHQYAMDDRHLLSYAAAAGADPERVLQDLEAGTYEPRVQRDFVSGVRSGVNGTPTFFINGERHDGPWDLSHLLAALTRAARTGAPSQ